MSPPAKRFVPRQQSATSLCTLTDSHFDEEGARKCVEEVKAELGNIVSESKLLTSQPLQKNLKYLSYFDRSEMKLGRKLGEGAFSGVYEIEGFNFREDINTRLSKRNQRVREYYQTNAVSQTGNDYRFVLKHLKHELLEGDSQLFSNALCDMAVEAAFLLRLEHKNILSLRGLPTNGLQALHSEGYEGFFLILDRLPATLDDRINLWCEKPEAGLDDEVLQTKLKFSLQIANALEYLHSRRLVYRDLKPQNLGIDRRGTVKLFDFGLCRELPANKHAKGTYSMSGGAGTRRYMAPEVALNLSYNCKVDVYSWSMVVWQMFSGVKPYAAYGKRDHSKYVCTGNERPPLSSEEENRLPHGFAVFPVPESMHPILREAWAPAILDRADMKTISNEVSRILESIKEHSMDLEKLANLSVRGPSDSPQK